MIFYRMIFARNFSKIKKKEKEGLEILEFFFLKLLFVPKFLELGNIVYHLYPFLF